MGGGDDDSSDPATLSAATSESSSHIGAAKGTAPNDSTAIDMGAAVNADNLPPVAKGPLSNVDAAKAGNADNPPPVAKGPLSNVDAAKAGNADNPPPVAKAPLSNVGAAGNADNPPPAAKGPLSDVDAAKAANHKDSTATAIDAHKGTPDTSLPTAKGSTPDTSLLTAKGSTPDTSLPSAMDASKGLLATDVEAGKGTTTKESLPAIVDPAKGTNTTESLADNIDGSTGKLPTAATAAPPPPSLEVAVPLPPKFDIVKANGLINHKNWQGLDDHLRKFVADYLGNPPQDSAILHPGLLSIPREQRLIQLLQDESFEDAATFFDEFIKPLKRCASKFKPLNLESQIDDLMKLVDKRSISSYKNNVEGVSTVISDYILLYFPSTIMCQDEADHEVEGTWQFAKRLPIPENEISSPAKSQKYRQGFRCLACGWTVNGTLSISSLRYHITHVSKAKCCFCPKVTQDMLDRLKMVGLKLVPNLSSLAVPLKNKRKGSSSASAADQNTDSSSLALPLSGAHVDKKLKKIKSISTTSQTVDSSRPAADPVANRFSVGVDCKFILEKVDNLQKISSFLMAQNNDSVVPSARARYLDKAMELERVAVELKMEAAKAGSDISVHGEMPQVATPNALAVSAPLPVEMPPETQDEVSD